jgi:hypothetical protein
MKKILALLLAAVMVLSMAACGNNANTDETQATEATETAASALEILETIWAKYGEDEKFAIIGGNMESAVTDGPGNYDLQYAENLPFNLLIPEAEIANVDQVASMIHGMNANTFTSGVFHLVDGVSAETFAATMNQAIAGNMWMCGFPERQVIVSLEGGYVVIAFGVNDAMTPFFTHLQEAFPEANILFDEPIA